MDSQDKMWMTKALWGSITLRVEMLLPFSKTKGTRITKDACVIELAACCNVTHSYFVNLGTDKADIRGLSFRKTEIT